MRRWRGLVLVVLSIPLLAAETCEPPPPDADGDGLSDAREAELGTLPDNPDTDGDGLSDGEEVDRTGTNPLADDSDGDGIRDDRDFEATTVFGAVRGQVEPGGPRVVAWRGLPFAAPVTPELRFRAPQPHPGWEGVLPYSDDATVCLQPRSDPQMPYQGSEDCLKLDVFAPLGADGYAVMVWIHGGGFIGGSKNGGDWRSFAEDAGVVVVAINYRVGPLGFLARSDLAEEDLLGGGSGSTGNQGLLDQIAALEWVRDSIASFGGDPDEVTIFGTSAGGTSVVALTASPLARGLFHHAIAQSPGFMGDEFPGLEAPSRFLIPARERSIHAAEYMGCGGSVVGVEEPEELACLRALGPAQLVAGWQGDEVEVLPGLIQYWPNIDGVALEEQPVTALRDEDDVPLLIGTTANETELLSLAGGSFFLKDTGEYTAELVGLFGEEQAATLEALYDPEDFDTGGSVPGLYHQGASLALARLRADLIFHCQALAVAGASPEVPAYVYHFAYTQRSALTSYPATTSCSEPMPPPEDCHIFTSFLCSDEPEPGEQWICTRVEPNVYQWECRVPILEDLANHASETTYLVERYGFNGDCSSTPSQDDLSAILQFAWGEFARSEGAYEVLGVTWPPYTAADPNDADIDVISGNLQTSSSGTFVSEIDGGRCAALRELGLAP